jgi:DNA gyrase subunit A
MSDHQEIIETEISDELSDSFLEYSMSVIVSRALPDVRDGLKPVHRRILWSMYTQGMRPDRGYNKCARATGDIMGKYHPHGDSAIYDALVRLAQPWSMRICLVDGHGNFGSLDDGPAAARYTECRLSEESMSMVQELEEDTVDFKPNYDGREKEPVVLPASFPNLIVNGSTGIAVGMATNMAPHNLVEVIEGVKQLIINPKLTLEELMKIIPGPDFPTGGVVIGKEGIIEAYRSGKGAFKIRAKVDIEAINSKKQGLIITELPYNVGPEKIIGRIKDLVNDKKLQGVSDVKNYSDRRVGLRLVVEIKNGFSPQLVLDELYRLTQLEESFSISNVALVNNQPRTLGLIELCKHYIAHRTIVVKRRTEHRLRKAQSRAHILEGLIVALASIEEVVTVIKKSKDTADARKNLMSKYTLSEIQAEAILEMTLRRLTSLEVNKLKEELKELKKLISELTKILKSSTILNQLIIEELEKVSTAFGTKRKSQLLDIMPTAQAELDDLKTTDDPCRVYLDYRKYLSKTLLSESRSNSKFDVFTNVVTTNNRSELIAVTSMGRILKFSTRKLTDKPVKINEVIQLIPAEEVVSIIDPKESDIFLFTSNGQVKMIDAELLTKNGVSIIKLKNNDSVVGAASVGKKVKKFELVAVTSNAQLIRFDGKVLNPQGISAAGVAGMKLEEGAKVIYFTVITQVAELSLMTMTDKGSIKRSKMEEFPAKGRATGGVRCMGLKKAETEIVAAIVGAKLVIASDVGLVNEPKNILRRDASGESIKETPLAIGLKE